MTAGAVALATMLVAQQGGAAPEPSPWIFYGELGGATFAGKPYALAEPGAELRTEGYHVAIGATLRLGQRGLRRQDFDEPGDFGAILRVVDVGRPGEPLHLQAGSQPELTLGRGTVLGGLRPAVDPDHGHLGVHLRGTGGGFAFDALASDVLSAQVFGARVEVPAGAPLGTDRIVLGGTYAIDPLAQLGPTQRVTPAAVAVASTKPAQLASVDLTVMALRTEALSLAPYLEGAALIGSGSGLHLGAASDIHAGPDTTVSVQAEWRHRFAGYLPHYFDAFYEVERVAYPTVHGPPKLAYARASPAGDGLLVSARLRQGGLTMGASVEGGGPIEATLFAEARLPVGADLSLLVARRGAFGPADVFDVSGELWSAVEVRVPIVPAVYVFGTAAQLYHLVPELGRPAPVSSVSLGLGAIGGL